VLDLSRALSGPFAGRILADLGADVVKVELPGADIAQTYGKVTRGRSGLYAQLNAGKRSIVLDLRLPGDVARLLDLAGVCDVVVENFRPGILDGFGAGWPALSAVNERLVMLSISGFGQDGPEASRPAYAPIIHAESGLIGRQADVSKGPPADIALALARRAGNRRAHQGRARRVGRARGLTRPRSQPRVLSPCVPSPALTSPTRPPSVGTLQRLTREGRGGTHRAKRQSADPGDGRGPGRSVEVAGVAGAP